MDVLLNNKICAVTGASRGIGAAIAKKFLEEGAIVYALSRTAPDYISEDTPKAIWLSCDVSNEESAEAAINTILAKEGRLDVLVNNAGITRDGLLMRMKTEDWEAVLATNLNSAFFLSRAAVRSMLKQRSGVILNVSSVVGITGNGGQTN